MVRRGHYWLKEGVIGERRALLVRRGRYWRKNGVKAKPGTRSEGGYIPIRPGKRHGMLKPASGIIESRKPIY